jgi:hypothetical protein
MVIKTLRRRKKILAFTILLQAGVNFNHDPPRNSPAGLASPVKAADGTSAMLGRV